MKEKMFSSKWPYLSCLQACRIFHILWLLNTLAELFWFGRCSRERIIQYSSYIWSGEVRTEWRRCSRQGDHIFHVFKLAISFVSSSYWDLADSGERELYNKTVNIGSCEVRTKWRRRCSLQDGHIFHFFKLDASLISSRIISFISFGYRTLQQHSSDLADVGGRELYNI